jgi:hypothetical protein
MPISNSYPKGIPVEDQDLFVGTKAYNNRTVNYTAQGVADYLNINSKVSIGGQMSFQFTIVPNIPKTIAFDGGGGNNTSFSAITKLIVSAIDVSTANITIFLNYLNNSQVLLSQQNQPNFFGHYKITGYTQIGTSAFYELDLEFIGGNGTIIDKQYYDLVSFVLSAESPIPTLQQVLDNNHDLVDGNNFQGTNAGLNNTGTDVNGLGNSAAEENTGNYVNSIGFISGASNTGDNNNFLGTNAGGSNSGNSVNAMGNVAGQFNTANNVNAIGYNAGNSNTFSNVNLFGENAQADENGQTVLSKDGTIMARISTTDLTATRKYNLPDADGTIALTSDIPTGIITGSGTVNTIPKWTSSTNIGNSFITENIVGTVVIANNGRTLKGGNTVLSIQRAQTQIDFVLGEPTSNQPNILWSDNTESGLDIYSTGRLAFRTGGTNIPTSLLGLVQLSTGQIQLTQTPATGTTSDFILLRDSSGNVKQIAYPTIPSGGVTTVTATSPITSSGGTTPIISTSMATNKLIGRSTAGTGVMEEITVGTGLSLSGGTLNATAQTVGFEQNFLLMGS